MRLASPSRRALGVFAASAIGMSTAVLGVTGVAQASSSPVALTGSTTLTVPAGVCTVEWVLNGGAGATVGSFAGGAGHRMTIHMSVTPGETIPVSNVPVPGGAASAGGGAGGDGVALEIDGSEEAVAAGGGGAGTQAAGGAVGNSGSGYAATETYNGGDPATGSAGGQGGTTTDTTSGHAGVDGADHAGGDGAAGAGGGGGGVFGGGGGASDGTNGAGGGGGADLEPSDSDATETANTGAAGITYEFQDCTADEMPLAPTDLTAQGGNGQLTVDFVPAYRDSGVNPDTWEYRVGTGAWTSVDPDYNYDNNPEFVVDHLTNGTPATVSVRGISDDGIAGPAASVTGTPFLPIGAPTHVAYTVSGSVVTITWDAPATAGTYGLAGYQAGLGYSWGQSGGLAFACDTDATVHVCKAPAPPGPSYSAGVVAVDAQGNAGDASPMLNIGKIAAPSSVPASNGTLTVPGGGAGSHGSVVKGQKVTLHGSGYAPNTLISVLVYSTPQVLTTTTTDGSGSFTIEVTVPAGLPDGNHTLVASGADPSGQIRYMNLPITVTGGNAELAYTGASVLTPALAGLGALVLGGGLLMASRRRSAR